MDYEKLQQRLYKGYGKAASRIGQSFNVYRSNSLLNPVGDANCLMDIDGNKLVIKASLTSVMDYSHYNKPTKPDLFCLVDATDLKIGDYLVCTQGGETDSGILFIADLQPAMYVPVMQTNTMVSITRVAYSDVSGGFQPEEYKIAENLPVFMISKKDKSKTPAGFPESTLIEQHIPEWEFKINARGFKDLKKGDIIIDSYGRRFEIAVPELLSFGYTILARELPMEAR
jgi:hypothetical protein